MIKQCLQFPALPAAGLLAVLRALAQADFKAVVQSELIVGKVSDTSWRIFLPVHADAMQGGEAAVTAFREKLKVVYKDVAGFDVGREAAQGFAVSTAGLVPPMQAAIVLALQVDADGDAPPPSREKMIVVKGSEEGVANVIPDIARQGRDVRHGGLQALDTGKVVGFLLLTDDAEDYGMVSSHLRRNDLAAPTFAMVPRGLGFARLWLEDTIRVGDGQGHKDLSVILAAARAAGALPEGVTDIVVLFTTPTSLEIFLHRKDTINDAPEAAETIASRLDPVQPFDITTIEFCPDKDATEALAANIKSLRRRVGYQVALLPLPRGVGPGVDLEPILEEIANLQLQVDQITALGAPQLRLMRFSDAQLPCMIDGLRRLPPKKLTDGTLRYAASHSAGRAEPAHYLLYDPQFTFMRIAEAHWRADVDPHPISYWLEPFVAEAQLKRPSKTQIFVPSGHFMAPSLAHFGGQIDETLRLVLGNLFDGQQPLLSDPNRAAYYMFTPSDAQDFRLEVEVLDGDAFRPLRQQLGWINDYLQVRSPVAVDAARLAEVATGLYEGQVAKALMGDLNTDMNAHDAVWATAQATVEKTALETINMIDTEMDAVSSRIVDLHRYLELANREMAGLERIAASATAALKGLDAIGDDLAAQDLAMLRSRDDFESRVAAEVAIAEDLIDDTQTRVEQLRDRLQRIRDWGTL